MIHQKPPLELGIHLKTDFWSFSDHNIFRNDIQFIYKTALKKATSKFNNALKPTPRIEKAPKNRFLFKYSYVHIYSKKSSKLFWMLKETREL